MIPMSLRKKIPRNNIHRWQNEDEDKYEGCDLNDLVKSEIGLLKEFVRLKNVTMRVTRSAEIQSLIPKSPPVTSSSF